jgi:hypothetical protein
MGVGHTWCTVQFGQSYLRMVDVKGNPLDSFISADIPAPMLTSPPPPPHCRRGTPFCSPRGALIIIRRSATRSALIGPPGSVKR